RIHCLRSDRHPLRGLAHHVNVFNHGWPALNQPFAAPNLLPIRKQTCYFGRVALGSPLGSKNTSIPPFSLLVNAAACSPSLPRTAITPRFSSHPMYAIWQPAFPLIEPTPSPSTVVISATGLPCPSATTNVPP